MESVFATHFLVCFTLHGYRYWGKKRMKINTSLPSHRDGNIVGCKGERLINKIESDRISGNKKKMRKQNFGLLSTSSKFTASVLFVARGAVSVCACYFSGERCSRYISHSPVPNFLILFHLSIYTSTVTDPTHTHTYTQACNRISFFFLSWK